MAKPFLKWAGDKSQSLIYINEFLSKIDTFENYYEPFLGGAAVFFFLEKRIWPV